MILIHVDPLTFKYGAQTMIFWSRALLRLFLQCFFKMAVLYCLNDNLSSKMNFQHFNIHRLQMQTQKKQIQDKKNGRNCPVSGAWCPPPSLGQNPNFYRKFVLHASLISNTGI